MTAPLRVVFFGTPEFAAIVLGHLLAADGLQVVATYAQPDRPAGRGRKLQPTPVHALATQHGIACHTPTRLRDPQATAAFAAQQPDLGVVAAYGKILPPSWLATPRLGLINVHASLLPRHRGAAPIAYAIGCGDSHSGVSIMQMDAGLDTGPVFCREPLPLSDATTAASLTVALAELGARALLRELPAIAAGQRRAIAQDALPPLGLPGMPKLQPSLAPRLDKAAGRVDFTAEAAAIARQVRAFYPWPGTFVQNGAVRLGLIQARADLDSPQRADPGTVVEVGREGLRVACGSGSLWLQAVRPAGRGTMPAAAWWSGRRLTVGAALVDGLMQKGVEQHGRA